MCRLLLGSYVCEDAVSSAAHLLFVCFVDSSPEWRACKATPAAAAVVPALVDEQILSAAAGHGFQTNSNASCMPWSRATDRGAVLQASRTYLGKASEAYFLDLEVLQWLAFSSDSDFQLLLQPYHSRWLLSHQCQQGFFANVAQWSYWRLDWHLPGSQGDHRSPMSFSR